MVSQEALWNKSMLEDVSTLALFFIDTHHFDLTSGFDEVCIDQNIYSNIG